jgi:hypothetical protein
MMSIQMVPTIEKVILQKFRALPRGEQQEVLSFLEFLEYKQHLPKSPQSTIADEQLAAAARALLADYQTDPELVAFTTLDGEEFYA